MEFALLSQTKAFSFRHRVGSMKSFRKHVQQIWMKIQNVWKKFYCAPCQLHSTLLQQRFWKCWVCWFLVICEQDLVYLSICANVISIFLFSKSAFLYTFYASMYNEPTKNTIISTNNYIHLQRIYNGWSFFRESVSFSFENMLTLRGKQLTHFLEMDCPYICSTQRIKRSGLEKWRGDPTRLYTHYSIALQFSFK